MATSEGSMSWRICVAPRLLPRCRRLGLRESRDSIPPRLPQPLGTLEGGLAPSAFNRTSSGS